MENTVQHFWKMVYEQGVTKIIALCQTIGKSSLDEVYLYFPKKVGHIIEFENLQLVYADEHPIKKSNHIVTRKFNIIETDGGKVLQSITHEHFLKMPDWSIPEDDSI